MIEEKWHVRLVATLICAVSLMSAALWNGYPIVYSDTASYIISGFHVETLIDRPITYGLFIRACSFNGLSLWTVALAQSMLLAHVIGLSLKSIGIVRSLYRAAIIAATALVTGLPFVCGQIITDTFTPILLFTLYLLLVTERTTTRGRLPLYAIFLLSFAMHMSHVPITALLLLIWIAARQLMLRGPSHAGWGTIGVIVLLSVVGILAMGTALAKSKNTFFAARMAEAGILQRYLEEHCGDNSYRLCARSGTIPHDADAFLWAEDTPLNVFDNRQEMEDELGRIARGSFTEAPLVWMHVKAALSSIGSQFTRFAVGDGNGDFHEGTVLHERIGTFFPSGIGQFDAARQMNKARFQGPLVNLNRFYGTVMITICIVVPILLMLSRLKIPSDSRRLSLFLLCGLVLNVAVNAGLVMVADRFGTKTAWLLPFTALLLVCVSIPTLRDRVFYPCMK